MCNLNNKNPRKQNKHSTAMRVYVVHEDSSRREGRRRLIPGHTFFNVSQKIILITQNFHPLYLWRLGNHFPMAALLVMYFLSTRSRLLDISLSCFIFIDQIDCIDHIAGLILLFLDTYSHLIY